ncbi:MAG: flavin reductase family protein [Candidatus Neomarinimicrobiota bacterium]|nr:flavin reductase family protein [Candidatus Neomarinimicrobiota bacterium]
MIGSILPRPIALVSTISAKGKNNLAPFSYFNGVCSNPPSIMFAPSRRGYDGQTKDTLNNIKETKEFVINIVSEDFAKQMVLCSTDYDPNVDEFSISELTPIKSVKIKSSLVKEAKISFECELQKIIPVGNPGPGGGFVVIGTIILFHIDDELYNDGYINIEKLSPIGRLAGNNYTRVQDSFEIKRKIKPD